jgi:hypothetical protein
MTSQVRFRLDADARNPAEDAVRVQKAPAVWFVVAFVRVHLAWATARVPARPEGSMEEGDRVEHGLEHHRVVHVRRGQERSERNALGIDHKSTTTWRFEPGFARSVGFGPVAWPPFLPGYSSNPRPRGSSRSGRHRSSAATARARAGPRPRLLANRAAAASRSCHNHSPSPAARTTTDSPCAARRAFRRVPRDSRSAGDRPWASAVLQAIMAPESLRVGPAPSASHYCSTSTFAEAISLSFAMHSKARRQGKAHKRVIACEPLTCPSIGTAGFEPATP